MREKKFTNYLLELVSYFRKGMIRRKFKESFYYFLRGLEYKLCSILNLTKKKMLSKGHHKNVNRQIKV